MESGGVFLTLGIICVLWGVVSGMQIGAYLSARGVKINWLFYKIFLPKYVGQYRDITVKETGKPGWWYYSFVYSMLLALALVLIGIVLKAI